MHREGHGSVRQNRRQGVRSGLLRLRAQEEDASIFRVRQTVRVEGVVQLVLQLDEHRGRVHGGQESLPPVERSSVRVPGPDEVHRLRLCVCAAKAASQGTILRLERSFFFYKLSIM